MHVAGVRMFPPLTEPRGPAMGRGYVFRPSYTIRKGDKREKRYSEIWHIGFSRQGKKYRESSGSTVKADAEALLARRLAEMRAGGPTPSELKRVNWATLRRLLEADHKRKGNKSRINSRLAHLEAFFGGWRAMDIDEAAIAQYTDARTLEGAAGATINRELAALRRAMNLAQARRLVERVPAFEMMPENVREGFIGEAEFDKLRAALPARLRPLAETLYVTGWRKADALSRTWDDVDLEAGWIRIEGSQTKEGRGRQFPLIPRLRAILEAQAEKRKEVEAATGRKVPHLFFYYERSANGQAEAGDPIQDFRHAWGTACRKAGVPGLRPHDLRRSAARHFIRAGISENVARAYTGHKSRSIFDRYDITAEADLLEGGDKLSAFFRNGDNGSRGAKNDSGAGGGKARGRAKTGQEQVKSQAKSEDGKS